MDWRNLMKQSVTVGAQLLWGGRYGCNNGRYGCTIVMSYTEINKAVSQWLLTFNLCVSVTWPLTCAFHIPCTHTPEIIDMHRGVCDNISKLTADDLLWRHRHIGQPLAIVTSQWPIVPTGIYGRMMLRSARVKVIAITCDFLFIFGPPCFNTGHH